MISCPSQVPVNDFKRTGGVTSRKTGAPFTNLDGLARTAHVGPAIVVAEVAPTVLALQSAPHMVRINTYAALENASRPLWKSMMISRAQHPVYNPGP